MWSRLSLRVQIAVMLLFVLGGEAALSSVWLLFVLRRDAESHALSSAKVLLDRTGRELELGCAPDFSPLCVKPVLEGLLGPFARLRFESRAGGKVEVGQGSPGSAGLLSAKRLGGAHFSGQVALADAHRDAARLFQFYLANLLVAVMGFALLGAVAFNRAIARPVEKLSTIADRIGHLELPEQVSELDAPMLGQLTRAFERMSRALRNEQERTRTQIAELKRMNREVADARDSLVRQEKLATVGRLAAGVAHEVGNPLGGILGYAELLKLRGDEVGRDYGERIGREVARIDRTVRGLLDFSRPSETALTPLSLQASVQAALSLCHADKRFREVEARVELAPGLAHVLADEHRLSQVLVNLLLNAGDAMAGKGTVVVRAEPMADDASRIALTVDDSGPGISAEALPRIFDPFFSTKEVGQGTGLGLSICATIMEAFGGEIRADNRPEGGARFVLTFRAAA